MPPNWRAVTDMRRLLTRPARPWTLRPSDAGGSSKPRRRALIRALAVTLAVHGGLGLAQGLSAWVTGSVGIGASALHLLMGSVAHVLALAGIWLGTRPPDPTHPYGYTRYEHVASMGIGMLLLTAVGLIVITSLGHLVTPRSLAAPGIGAAVMAASAAANAGLCVFLRRRAQTLRSQVLATEAVHAWADGLAAVAVIAGLGLSRAGFPRLDPAVALALGLLVAWRSWTIIQAATAVLTDAAMVDLDAIRRAAADVPGVLDCHAVRCRGEAGRVRVDLHIHVPPELTVARAHEIARAVEARLRTEVAGISEVLVHVGAEAGGHGSVLSPGPHEVAPAGPA
jgi:cation diffusion facilitator family transporter